jgi:peptidyl-prolyl cis-trans isomerase SurA
MLTKKLFTFFFLLIVFSNFVKSQEIIIISKVDNEIITNIDIEIEKKYLLLLNNNLSKISKKDFFNLAKNSIIREKIKEKEVNKFFTQKNESVENKIIENFYIKLGFNNKNEFMKLLDEKIINIKMLKKKLSIDKKWNQLIYSKFSDKIRIDKNAIRKAIINYYNSKDKKYEYNISEITFGNEKDIHLKINEITKYIKKFGFEIAASKYSNSDTSQYSGEIGWIKETSLSKKIKNILSALKIDEISNPIETPSGYIILKLNDKRKIEENFDLKKELEQQVKFENNRQLNQFSLNYYKKLKKNTIIYENK